MTPGIGRDFLSLGPSRALLRSMGSFEFEYRPEVLPLPAHRVVYAGASSRRQLFLSYLFSDIEVESVPPGSEEDTSNVSAIMRGKLTGVHRVLEAKLETFGEKKLAIVSADTRTSTMTIGKDNKVVFVSRGKPSSHKAVRQTFLDMYDAYRQTGINPAYIVYSASGSLYTATGQRAEAVSATTVTLDPEFVRDASTVEGFSAYQELFRQFYCGKSYSEAGLSPIGLTDISAGLSLPVLSLSGAVLHINQVAPGDLGYPEILKKAIYDVAVGFSPAVLSAFHPEIHQKIDSWPWLNQMIQQCLSQNL